MVHDHNYLTARGVPVIVVNYADLLWSPHSVVDRLNDFFPCFDDMQANYIPQQGIDVFESNGWKAHGSVVEYGQQHDPVACCSYSTSLNQCERHNQGFSLLPDGELERALESVQYLQSFS